MRRVPLLFSSRLQAGVAASLLARRYHLYLLDLNVQGCRGLLLSLSELLELVGELLLEHLHFPRDFVVPAALELGELTLELIQPRFKRAPMSRRLPATKCIRREHDQQRGRGDDEQHGDQRSLVFPRGGIDRLDPHDNRWVEGREESACRDEKENYQRLKSHGLTTFPGVFHAYRYVYPAPSTLKRKGAECNASTGPPQQPWMRTSRASASGIDPANGVYPCGSRHCHDILESKARQLVGRHQEVRLADTRVQIEAEDWVRREWMPTRFGQQFSRERVRLSSGGVFDFDAVSADGKIVATISTSGARTSTGKYAVGKMLKIRSDIYFLLLAEADHRIVVLTERDMYDQCLKEAEGGRVPKSIEFVHVEIPPQLEARLSASRGVASHELLPDRKQS